MNQQFKKELSGEPVEIARRQEVKPGPAVIRTTVSGETKDYSVEIQKVDYSATKKNKTDGFKSYGSGASGVYRRDRSGIVGNSHFAGWKTGGGSNARICAGSNKRIRNLAEDMLKYEE